MIKYLFIIAAFICFQTNGQIKTLVDKGDSSIYLIDVNDTLSYISFADPENINNGLFDSIFFRYNNYEPEQPSRSYLLLTRCIENDTIVYRETFNKYCLNTSVEYFKKDKTDKERLQILFEGKDLITQSYLGSFEDSIYVEINGERYLGDLNTTIFNTDIPRPKRRSFDVRIYNEKDGIDFTVKVKIDKYTHGLIIRYEFLKYQIHSLSASYYLKNSIPNTVTSEDGIPIKFEFIDMIHYWRTDEIKYN